MSLMPDARNGDIASNIAMQRFGLCHGQEELEDVGVAAIKILYYIVS